VVKELVKLPVNVRELVALMEGQADMVYHMTILTKHSVRNMLQSPISMNKKRVMRAPVALAE
jgi:hypothetical protein